MHQGRGFPRHQAERGQQWVSIAAYARIRGERRETVLKWLEVGLLESFRVGRLVRIRNRPPRDA